jgi:hypothetical protein
MRLERLGEDLAACSGETIATHCVKLLAAEASTSGSSDAAPGSSIAASGMVDDVQASVDEPCSGF